MNSKTKKDIVKNINLLFDEISLLKSQIDEYKERARQAERRRNELQEELAVLICKDCWVTPVKQLKAGNIAVVAGHVRKIKSIEFYGSSSYRLFFEDGYQVGGCLDEVVAVIK